MSKAVKLKNNQYLSTQYVVHKRGGGWYYLNNILDNIYPVGSIFLTVADANPSTYFGGTWEKMSGGYLYGIMDGYPISNSTFKGVGTQPHTLTINEIPSHNHIIYYNTTESGLANGSVLGTPNSATNEKHYNGPYVFCSWTDTAGGGQAHSHNVAYIGVWVWKRIS